MTIIDSATIDWISDTTLYQEARTFCQNNPPPSNKQAKYLEGLVVNSSNWDGLIYYINHQRGRETLKREYKPFYDALWEYLNHSKTGLRQRVKTEFNLVNFEGITKNQEKHAMDLWAQELAQEFITHLVAEALWQQI